MSLRRTLRDQRGEGIVSGLILLAGALLPLLFLIGLVARVEEARLAVGQAAQAAVRAATSAPDPGSAQAAAQAEVAAEQSQTPATLTLQLAGTFARGDLLEATVTGVVPVGELPFVGSVGSITVQASASAPIDSYRSLDPAAAT